MYGAIGTHGVRGDANNGARAALEHTRKSHRARWDPSINDTAGGAIMVPMDDARPSRSYIHNMAADGHASVSMGALSDRYNITYTYTDHSK